MTRVNGVLKAHRIRITPSTNKYTHGPGRGTRGHCIADSYNHTLVNTRNSTVVTLSSPHKQDEKEGAR